MLIIIYIVVLQNIEYICSRKKDKKHQKNRFMSQIVSDQNFQSFMASDKPVMVDFSATWCGPCKALAPTVEEIAKEYEGRAIVGKADVDECPEISAKFRIMSVPTVLFFKGGELKDKSVGNVPKNTLVEKLNALL